MLHADREANGRGCYLLVCKFLWRELRVSSGVGVNHQRFHVSHVGKQREYLERVDELPRSFLSAIYLESEDGCCSLREELLIYLMVRV